jgi:hypothetical protein
MACRADRQSKTARRLITNTRDLPTACQSVGIIVRCTRGRLTASAQGDICALHAAARQRTIELTQRALFPSAVETSRKK